MLQYDFGTVYWKNEQDEERTRHMKNEQEYGELMKGNVIYNNAFDILTTSKFKEELALAIT